MHALCFHLLKRRGVASSYYSSGLFTVLQTAPRLGDGVRAVFVLKQVQYLVETNHIASNHQSNPPHNQISNSTLYARTE